MSPNNNSTHWFFAFGEMYYNNLGSFLSRTLSPKTFMSQIFSAPKKVRTINYASDWEDQQVFWLWIKELFIGLLESGISAPNSNRSSVVRLLTVIFCVGWEYRFLSMIYICWNTAYLYWKNNEIKFGLAVAAASLSVLFVHICSDNDD